MGYCIVEQQVLSELSSETRFRRMRGFLLFLMKMIKPVVFSVIAVSQATSSINLSAQLWKYKLGQLDLIYFMAWFYGTLPFYLHIANVLPFNWEKWAVEARAVLQRAMLIFSLYCVEKCAHSCNVVLVFMEEESQHCSLYPIEPSYL